MKKSVLLILAALSVLFASSALAEKQWELENGSFTSGTFCLTLPEEINNELRQSDRAVMLSNSAGDTLLAVVLEDIDQFTLDQLDSNLETDDPEFVAGLWSISQGTHSNTLISRTKDSGDFFDYYLYVFDFEFSGDHYAAFDCIMNMRGTNSFCEIRYLTPMDRYDAGMLHFTGIIDSAYTK